MSISLDSPKLVWISEKLSRATLALQKWSLPFAAWTLPLLFSWATSYLLRKAAFDFALTRLAFQAGAGKMAPEATRAAMAAQATTLQTELWLLACGWMVAILAVLVAYVYSHNSARCSRSS